MSYSVDVNILLYASDTSSPWHDKAADFLASCVVRPELFCLAWPTLMSYLRIATHPSIFAAPLSPREAQANVDALLALPRVRALGEAQEFWTAYLALTDAPVRGNLVPDAHLAALLLEHGVHLLYSHDRDFLKFPTLRVEDPLAP
jgi:toxin-antitoxin system PIN domain toxin